MNSNEYSQLIFALNFKIYNIVLNHYGLETTT